MVSDLAAQLEKIAGPCVRVIGIGLVLLSASCSPDKGIDLNEWRLVGQPVWQVMGSSAIAGPSDQSGYLVSAESYANFRLRAEFYVDDDTNSGIFLRCNEISEPSDVNPDNCYEVNIWDNHPNQDFRTGSIVTLKGPDVSAGTLGRWNVYEIVAYGAHIEVRLNGQTVNSLDNDRASVGQIALQYAGRNKLEFRNLEIAPL